MALCSFAILHLATLIQYSSYSLSAHTLDPHTVLNNPNGDLLLCTVFVYTITRVLAFIPSSEQERCQVREHALI